MNNMSSQNLLAAELDGYRIHGYEGDYIFTGIQNSEHYYETDTLEKWTPLLGNVETVFDIGANLGNHTLYWAKYLHPKKIVSFEPFVRNYEALRKNIADNRLDSIVTAEMLAVGQSPGFVSAENVDVSNLGATTFKQVDDLSARENIGAVKMTSVDTYVEQHQLTVDFIKIDTEGFECAVLKGAEKTINRDHPSLWIEVSETSHAKVHAFLQAFGYVMVDVRGFNVLYLHQGKTDGKPLFDMDTIMDMMYMYQSKTNMYYANYEKVKRWLAEEKEKSQRATENFETAKRWLAEEKEKSAAALKRAAADYDALESRFNHEAEERASAEMKFMQLEFYLQQREEESLRLQYSLTNRIVQVEKDLRSSTKQAQDAEKKLKKKTLPPMWYKMAGSRVGRMLFKFYCFYHNSKRHFRFLHLNRFLHLKKNKQEGIGRSNGDHNIQ